MGAIREGEENRSATAPVAGGTVPIPKKLFRVGEIIEHTKISRQTLHTYTLLGLITEEKTTMAGHRLYDESVFARLNRIQELKLQDMTLREIRLRFDAEDAARGKGDPEGKGGK